MATEQELQALRATLAAAEAERARVEAAWRQVRPPSPRALALGIEQTYGSGVTNPVERALSASREAERAARIAYNNASNQAAAAARQARDAETLRSLGIAASAPVAAPTAAPATTPAVTPAATPAATPVATPAKPAAAAAGVVDEISPQAVVSQPAVLGSPAPATAAQILGLQPAVADRVEVTPQGDLVPVRCTSGVCRPTIQAGDFYANAHQSGIARDPNFTGRTEFDRYADTMLDARVGGRQAILQNDVQRRVDAVTQLRQTPQYLAEFRAALENTGGDVEAAHGLAQRRFLSSTMDPNMALALSENDGAAALDAASSRQAAAALAAGQAQLPNRLSQSMAETGYYGPGILPFGAAPDAPGQLMPGAAGPLFVGGANVPETYTAGARAQAGGAAGMQGRADALENAQGALLSSAAQAVLKQLTAEATLLQNDPAVRYAQQFGRAQANALFPRPSSRTTPNGTTLDVMLGVSP